jgi:hypothetical protein
MDPPGGADDRRAQWLRNYTANLGALYAVDRALAAQIDQAPFADCPKTEPTRDGRLTLRLAADDGKPIYAHSRYRPLEEARTLVDNAARRKTTLRTTDEVAEETETVEEEIPPEELDHACFLVSGLGLGYAVGDIEDRFSKPYIIVAENDLTVIKAALCVTDFSAALNAGRLTFLVDTDKAELHLRLRPIITPLMLGLHFVTLPHTRRCNAAFHARIFELLRDFITYSRLQLVSAVRNARIVSQNAAFNLATYLSNPGIEVFEKRAAGYPAVVVAAGPSLARNVDQLAALRDRVVIIAVQTVLKTLLARGIRPHFVTSLDYHEISAQFFRGVADFGDTILVAEPKVTWHVPDHFHGRTHLLGSGFIDELLRDDAPQRARLEAGSTVAHLAFYLAQHLSCDPILLVGQDLSFTEGLYYPPGMPIENIWRPEMSRFQTIEMKQWERIARARAGLKLVKDIHGRDTYTDDQMFTYAEQFQSDFLGCANRVIHATEGGMALAGTEVMTLAEAAAECCTRPLPDDLFAHQAPAHLPDLRARATQQIDQRMRELVEMREIADQTRTLLKKLTTLVEQRDEFNRLVGRVDDLRGRMQRYDRTYHLVTQVSQLAELRRVHADRSIHDGKVETPAMARRRLRRDVEYVDAFIDGCRFMERILPQALERLEEQMP